VPTPPGTAGYSGTPQARKLGLKSGHRVDLHGAPDGWELHEPPDGLLPAPAPERADVVLAFITEPDDLLADLPELARRIFPDGAVWILWPRRAAGHRSDMDENAIRAAGLGLGLVDVKVAAVDRDWSGLRLVWRREERKRRHVDDPVPPGRAGRADNPLP
jgi:hypothetical protein